MSEEDIVEPQGQEESTPSASIGQIVRYTGIDGIQRKVSISELDEAMTATLVDTFDGGEVFPSVPYSAGGEPNTWSFASE